MAAPVASTSAIPADVTHQDSADIMPAFNAWRQMLSSFTGLALTGDQNAVQSKLKSEQDELRECKRCEAWRDEVIRESRYPTMYAGTHTDVH